MYGSSSIVNYVVARRNYFGLVTIIGDSAEMATT